MFITWQRGKARVVTDHRSSGLNDGIPKDEAHVRYDDMRPFGQELRSAKNSFPQKSLVLFKSDVASAFLNLPAHPIWQLNQIVVVDGKFHLVRRLVFGNRASPRCWCAVSGLICWIAIHKYSIQGLHVYMDDFFGWDFADNLVMFHDRLRPKRQVQLLRLWDSIACPFDDKKQEHGSILKIIGFYIDIERGSISLCPESITDIISKLDNFLNSPDRKARLLDWQRLGGHLNWLLNVLPWGRPALSELYKKTSGKIGNPFIFINATVRSDLTWLTTTIPQAIGIRFIGEGCWSDVDADLQIYTDASLNNGLGFTFLNEGFVYQRSASPHSLKIDIFFLELLAILSGLHHLGNLRSPPRRVLLFTDSLDSVGVLNSLAPEEKMHNAVLLGISHVMLASGMDLRVRHIEGRANIKADLLSRLLLEEFHLRFPSICVRQFEPPRHLLPTQWRECF